MSSVEAFESFLGSQTVTSCVDQFHRMCESFGTDASGQSFQQFFGSIKKSLLSRPSVSNNTNTSNVRAHRQHNNNWKVSSILHKLHLRASNTSSYGGNNLLKDHEVLVVGGGPCGLRAAIEMQFLGARRVTVVEKRDTFSRFNVIRLWPCVIDDLKALGAKKIYGKFCAGSIDHVSIRQLQLILLKVALLCGVRVVVNAKFESLCPRSLYTQNPIEFDCDCNVDIGYARAHFSGTNAHLVQALPFSILIGADGRRNSLSRDFPRKEFRGRLAIAITANFENTRSVAEARVEEISGTSYIYNQQWFKELQSDTGIELENFTYYKDETHFVVMTATKNSLLQRGVLLHDHSDSNALLAAENISRHALLQYTRDATEWTTGLCQPFVHNHNGIEDVQIFDFTSMYAAENACKVKKLRCIDDQDNKYLLMGLVGDALLEPFWPIGSGLGRGFLSAFDSAWMAREWVTQGHEDESRVLSVLAQRESIYKILSQTTAENVSKTNWTLNPQSRYTNLNSACALTPDQVIHLLYDNLRKPSLAAKRARRATVAVSGADLNRAVNYDIRPKHEWLYNKVYDQKNEKIVNCHYDLRSNEKFETIEERTERLNNCDSKNDKTSLNEHQRYKHDWLLGRLDHEAIQKKLLSKQQSYDNNDVTPSYGSRDDSRMKSRIKDLEYKLRQSRGLLNEDRNILKKSNEISDKAQELQKMFDETKKAPPSSCANTKVGHIESEDWNVKIWNERAKVPSPPPLISQPTPRPERQLEVFQSKVLQANDMLQKLDCDPLSVNKSQRKSPPTREWIAQIQTELATRHQESSSSKQRSDRPKPNHLPVQTLLKHDPKHDLKHDPKHDPKHDSKHDSKHDPKHHQIQQKPKPMLLQMKPQMPLTIIEQPQEMIMNPLMTSQSETHILSRPECARCHAPINNTWERILVNGLMLHRSCLLCSVCRVQLRLSEVRNTQNFTCVVCSSNNNNARSMSDILRAKQRWITNVEQIDLRGKMIPEKVHASELNMEPQNVDVPDNNRDAQSDDSLNASESSSNDSDDDDTSTTTEEDDEEEEEDEDEEDEDEEVIVNGDTDSDVTWDSESDSDIEEEEKEKSETNIVVPSICVTNDMGVDKPLSPIQPLTSPKITIQTIVASPPTTIPSSNPITVSPQKSVQRPPLPRFSYTGSFTEKMLQRSQSQPSLFRSRPFQPLSAVIKHINDDDSAELLFADATTSSSTFSPLKRHSQMAPLITLEDV